MRKQSIEEKAFCENFNRLVDESGVSRADIARALDVSNGAITTWLSGTRMPRLNIIGKIADFFHVSRDALIAQNMDVQSRDVHDLLEDLFYDNPIVLRAVRNIHVDGKISDGNSRYKLDEVSKMYIKNTILLALKEAKEKSED